MMVRRKLVAWLCVVVCGWVGVVAGGRACAGEASRRRAEDSAAKPAPYFQTYEQEFTIVFRDEASAGKARVNILPLFDGREWAITCRWDDNFSRPGLRMRDVMAKHGYRGTYYLNGSQIRPQFRGTQKKLLVGGNSIGGHGWTHPFLSYGSRNRIFEEVMRVRAEQEAISDAPICSYAFSFMNTTNKIEGRAVSVDIAAALFRAGYYHIANSKFRIETGVDMPSTNLLPGDQSQPVEATFERYLGREDVKRANPCISFAMHAFRYNTAEKWQALEAQFDRYGNKPEWWYCNQSEYGAYRLQFQHTRVAAVAQGNELSVKLTRPALLDLNDPVPLTLEVAGVDRGAVTEVRAANAEVERRDSEAAVRFHLYHDRDQHLPTKIGWVANDENRAELADADTDEDFPTVTGLAWSEGGALKWALKNAGTTPLRDVRFTCRLPLAWQDDRHVQEVAAVEPGTTHVGRLELRSAGKGFAYDFGTYAYAVQVDFVLDGEPGRLHLTCRDTFEGTDPSWPAGGFVKLGPVPQEQLDTATAQAIARGEANTVTLKDGTVLEFGAPEPPDPKFTLEAVVGTVGRTSDWRGGGGPVVLLRSVIRSPVARRVVLRLSERRTAAVFLNGEKLEGPDAEAMLLKGDNPILIVTPAYGRALGLRLVTPGTSERLTDVSFVPLPAD